jgi:hypothetical protein
VKRNLKELYSHNLVRLKKKGVKGKNFNAYQLGITPIPAREISGRLENSSSPGMPQ